MVLENINVLFTAVLIYALVYAVILKVNVIEDKKIIGVIALMSAVIVSLTGIVTFAVFYAVRLFTIVILILFLVLIIVGFGTGTDFGKTVGDIGEGNGKWILLGIIGVIFFLVLAKSFFALNNSELNGDEEINTDVNIGVEFPGVNLNISDEVWMSFLFLVGLGIFVYFIGKE